MTHAKSGIRKLGHDLLVSVASTASSGARGCPVIVRGTRVASYATRSTAMPVAGEYKYTVHVTRTRILLLVNTCTRDEQVCCAAAKACMKNIVLAQLTKYLEYMLHTVSGYTVSTYNQSSPVYGYSVETVVVSSKQCSDVLHIPAWHATLRRWFCIRACSAAAIRNRPALSTTTTL